MTPPRKEIFLFGLLFGAVTALGITVGVSVGQYGWKAGAVAIPFAVMLAVIGWWMILSSKEAAARTDKLLDELLKETLHELNVPVATILANIEMARQNEQDEKQLRRFDRMAKSCDALLSLYRQLDYFIKKEIRQERAEVFELDKLIAERLDQLDDQLHFLHIEAHTEALKVQCDPEGLRKVFDNLLSNAVKYNVPNGSIKIAMCGTMVSIEDTGIGIAPEHLIHIFDRYYQVDQRRSGYGIGLNIVKSYCDEYAIPLFIDSTIGKGTKISLNFKNVANPS